MQSATPRHPRNHRNISQSFTPAGNGAARTGPLAPGSRGGPRPYMLASEAERRTRLRAGLAYAIPFVPAFLLLARERRHRWVRFHAAQSLLFFTLLVLVQIALFAALVLLGGAVDSLPVTAVAGLAFYVLYLVVGILGLVFWLRLIADAMSGRSTRFRFLSGPAMHIEEALARLQRLVPARHAPARIDEHAHHHT